MMKRRVVSTLPAAAENQTLLAYLSGRFNYHSPEEWQQKIAQGELLLNGAVCCNPEQMLQCGMILEYVPQMLCEPAVATDYRIVYADDVLLVIDKPGNLPVHPAGPYFANTLWALLEKAGYGKLHMVNRLDRETSGLLIAARTAQSAGELAKTLPAMRKCYYTLVHGNFPDRVCARGWLTGDTRSPIRKKQRFIAAENESILNDIEGKFTAVETIFTPLRHNCDYTLLSAELHTGRMHQIRATLHGMGFPVAGDKLYGLDENFYRRFAQGILSESDRRQLVLERQALHCAELSFVHPISGKTMTFTAELPREIADLSM